MIADITKRMGAGMAEYIPKEVLTVDEYDKYCYYVAGLVGVGLSKLFAVSELEGEWVMDLAEGELSNSMGKFLQKTNIIRDYLEVRGGCIAELYRRAGRSAPLRIVTSGISGGRCAHTARFATPADSLLQGFSTYRGLHVCRGRFGRATSVCSPAAVQLCTNLRHRFTPPHCKRG